MLECDIVVGPRGPPPRNDAAYHAGGGGLDAASAACLTQRSKTFDNAHSVAWFVFHPVATFRERAR